jgi:acyl carrier protein
VAPASMEGSRSLSLRDVLATTSPGRQRGAIKDFVRNCALRVLGQDDSRMLEDVTPLGEVGLDSLLAVELRNAIGRALSINLPATLLFDYPTVDALTEFLWTEVLAGKGNKDSHAPNNAEGRTGSDVLASIKELSDKDVEGLLATKHEEPGHRDGRLSRAD